MREDDVAALRERYSPSLKWARRFVEMGEYIKSIQDSYFAAFYPNRTPSPRPVPLPETTRAHNGNIRPPGGTPARNGEWSPDDQRDRCAAKSGTSAVAISHSRS